MTAAAIALALAALSVPSATLRAHAPPAVRVLPRPEIPWVVVVAVARSGVDVAAVARDLTERGARASLTDEDGLALLVVEGPPESEEALIAAAQAGAAGPLFVEGRTARTSTGVLPAGRPLPWPVVSSASSSSRPSPTSPSSSSSSSQPHPPQSSSPAGSVWRLPLPFSPWLLGPDGTAVRLHVDDTLARAGVRASAALVVGPAGAWLDLRSADLGSGDGRAADASAVRAALEAASAPIAMRALELLRARAATEAASARAVVGGAARRAAVRAALFGDAPVVEAPDLGVRLRAALVPAALHTSGTAAAR